MKISVKVKKTICEKVVTHVYTFISKNTKSENLMVTWWIFFFIFFVLTLLVSCWFNHASVLFSKPSTTVV